MKDYNVTWWNAETCPELNREWLGLVPEFFISATTEAGDGDLEQVCNAMDEIYMYGGFTLDRIFDLVWDEYYSEVTA